ncbi:ribonuclease HII [Dokdonia sp. Hel_I_53]|uniref:ribonuclease HII n=1 Tax=Dokdonia sp. Hel_I_53 TaxID=1566287 RepID=UPI00119BBF7B|nr:ribonuclease HII [Dokdonia sp. Hel_I_53]TVZ52177.1 RNase HII [Dokdonia sp. Hel_I_53]
MLKLSYHSHLIECGTDEAGRGCLAGPVTAAAVMLPSKFSNNLLTDSKLLTEKKRELLKPIIEEAAIAYAFSHVFMEEIDKINILQASITAMHRSLDGMIDTLSRKRDQPQHILVDGNKFNPYPDISHTTIVKGDSKYLPIAAASILAKTERDLFMNQIHEEYPMYNWKQNKGYPTKEHREAIRKFGVTKYHRKSFRLLPEQYEIKFID